MEIRLFKYVFTTANAVAENISWEFMNRTVSTIEDWR